MAACLSVGIEEDWPRWFSGWLREHTDEAAQVNDLGGGKPLFNVMTRMHGRDRRKSAELTSRKD